MLKIHKLIITICLLLFVCVSPAYAVGQIVGNWTFNEGSGIYANDSSGLNKNGTVVNTTWATNLLNGSVNGTALEFADLDRYVNLTGNNISLRSNTYTYAAWIKVADDSGGKAVFGTDNGGVPIYFVSIGSDEKANIQVRDAATNEIRSIGTTVLTNTWHHLVWILNTSTLSTQIYVDNNLENSTTIGSINFNTIPENASAIGEITRNSKPFDGFFNGTIDEVLLYNYSLNSSERTTLYQTFHPVPAYPVGGIVIPAVYPPLATTVNFTWHDTVYPSDEIQVAEDSAFNIMVHDGFHTVNYANVQLLAGKTYYWRLLQFNSTTGTYGRTSATQIFTLSAPSTPTGAGSSVQGIVYELLSGVQTPVSGATVYLYNATASYTFITSSNGYFLFQNLANTSTYNIYATNAPVYNPTSVFPVTTGNGTTVTNNLLITRFFSPFVPNYVYEKFIVRSVFDQPFPGVTVNVFEDGNVVATFSKVTDSMGQATFQLIKDTYYRVEFSGGGLSQTTTVYIFGKEEEYLLYVTNGFPTTPDRNGAVNFTLPTSSYNATNTNLSLIYNDTSGTTTVFNFYALNITNSNIITQVCGQQLTSTSVAYLNCSVPNNATFVYQWGFNASTTAYGNFSAANIITFGKGDVNNPIVSTGVNPSTMNWISVIIITLIASLFSIRKVKQGAIVVPLTALILWTIGWFNVSILLVSSAMILGILIYMRMSEVKVNF